jgi:hypothetical protein
MKLGFLNKYKQSTAAGQKNPGSNNATVPKVECTDPPTLTSSSASDSKPPGSAFDVEHGVDSVKLSLGDDQVAFVLPPEDPSRRYLYDGIDKRSLDTPNCEVKPSPLGGLGLFATKRCVFGDLLFSERPMLNEICLKLKCRSVLKSLTTYPTDRV